MSPQHLSRWISSTQAHALAQASHGPPSNTRVTTILRSSSTQCCFSKNTLQDDRAIEAVLGHFFVKLL